jgi:hypothetical protein
MEKRNKKKQNYKKDKIEEIFSDEKQITEILQRAVREAVEIHKRAGNPLATWKNGRLVLIKSNSLN